MQQSVHMPQGHRAGRGQRHSCLSHRAATTRYPPPEPGACGCIGRTRRGSAAATPSYAQVIQEAGANAQALLNTFMANPTPILSQVAQNQVATFQNLITALQTTGGAISSALTTTDPALLQAAFNDLASGNVEGAINNVLSGDLATVFPITGFIPTLSAALTQPLTNLVNAINAVEAGGVLSPSLWPSLGFSVRCSAAQARSALRSTTSAAPSVRATRRPL